MIRFEESAVIERPGRRVRSLTPPVTLVTASRSLEGAPQLPHAVSCCAQTRWCGQSLTPERTSVRASSGAARAASLQGKSRLGGA